MKYYNRRQRGYYNNNLEKTIRREQSAGTTIVALYVGAERRVVQGTHDCQESASRDHSSGADGDDRAQVSRNTKGQFNQYS